MSMCLDLGILPLSMFVNSYEKKNVTLKLFEGLYPNEVRPDTQDLHSMPWVPLTMPDSPASLSHFLVLCFDVLFSFLSGLQIFGFLLSYCVLFLAPTPLYKQPWFLTCAYLCGVILQSTAVVHGKPLSRVLAPLFHWVTSS